MTASERLARAHEDIEKQKREMMTPEGKTCADCFHFSRCSWLLSREGPETMCDWHPSRYREPKKKETT